MKRPTARSGHHPLKLCCLHDFFQFLDPSCSVYPSTRTKFQVDSKKATGSSGTHRCGRPCGASASAVPSCHVQTKPWWNLLDHGHHSIEVSQRQVMRWSSSMGTTATELENLETRLFRTGGAVFTSSLGMSTWKPGEWTEAKFQRCYTFFLHRTSRSCS